MLYVTSPLIAIEDTEVAELDSVDRFGGSQILKRRMDVHVC